MSAFALSCCILFVCHLLDTGYFLKRKWIWSSCECVGGWQLRLVEGRQSSWNMLYGNRNVFSIKTENENFRINLYYNCKVINCWKDVLNLEIDRENKNQFPEYGSYRAQF